MSEKAAIHLEKSPQNPLPHTRVSCGNSNAHWTLLYYNCDCAGVRRETTAPYRKLAKKQVPGREKNKTN